LLSNNVSDNEILLRPNASRAKDPDDDEISTVHVESWDATTGICCAATIWTFPVTGKTWFVTFTDPVTVTRAVDDTGTIWSDDTTTGTELAAIF
jgi:hypothetical protein